MWIILSKLNLPLLCPPHWIDHISKDSPSNTSKKVITYSSEYLRNCNDSSIASDRDCQLSSELCCKLADLNLLDRLCQSHNNSASTLTKNVKPRRKRSRKRGTRGGFRRTIRPISVNITERITTQGKNDEQYANLSNLRPIKPHDSNQLSLHIWNARSVCNKTTQTYDYVLEQDVDVLLLTETWMKSTDHPVVAELTPVGYSFINVPRDYSEERGGGIGIVYKSGLEFSLSPHDFKPETFEYASITGKLRDIRIVTVYRPHPTRANGFTLSKFFEEFEIFLSEIAMLNAKVILTGDFNFHLNKPNESDVKQFSNLVNEAGFTQHITKPTHRDGNTLDLLLSRLEDDLVTEWDVCDKLMSDHFFVSCNLQRKKPQPMKTVRKVRNYKEMDMQSFTEDLEYELVDNIPSNSSCNDLVNYYEECVTRVLDKHCPESTRVCSVRPRMPWYNQTIHEARRVRRRWENTWRKSRLDADKQIFLEKKAEVDCLINQSKSDYFKDKLFNADSKKQFNILNTLLNYSSKLLPKTDSWGDLANRFASFFIEKVKKIRDNLDYEVSTMQVTTSKVSGNRETLREEVSSSDTRYLMELRPVTEEEVYDLVGKLSNKCCLLDAVPTWLLKENKSCFVPFITNVINVSFESGVFPDPLKEAIISPVIKKQNLDSNTLQNYRPVSNIKVLAKVVEMAASSRLTEHMNNNNLTEKFQSAYKPLHLTESALLRVKNDFIAAIDNHKAVLLVMLDLSAAFDTIDHTIFIHRLKHDFRIIGTALQWFSSYLYERTNRVYIHGVSSATHTMKYGFPQGSILGPIGYSMYTHPIGKILRDNDISYHIYADDSQLYVTFDPRVPGAYEVALIKLQNCIAQIKIWMLTNKLQLNQAKTEFFIASSSHYSSELSDIRLQLSDIMITPSKSLRNLGVIFDPVLNMTNQVSSVVKSVNYHLRNLSRIRRHMDRDTCKLAVQALIFSRIDYGNALLLGATEKDIMRLQRVQNKAARLIHLVGRDHPSAPLLHQLHWLPIRIRIQFKILVYVYKCLHSLAPDYLSELLLPSTVTYATRSSLDRSLLHIPRTRTVTGDRAFHAAAPRLWNNLPRNIREAPTLHVFKSLLKTHLF